MVNGEEFEISYYAKKHSKFITRRGQWNEKCKYWFSKSLKENNRLSDEMGLSRSGLIRTALKEYLKF